MLDERERPSAEIAPQDLPRAFSRQSLARRSAIVSAGPIANFLLAILLYLTLHLIGVQEPVARVAAPPAGTPAAAAGFAERDKIVGIDGKEVRSWNEVRLRLIDPVIERRAAVVEVERDARQQQLSLDASALPQGEIERDFLGTLGLDLAHGGVSIASVLPGGAAARAGLQSGDQVLGVDGQPVGRSSALIDAIRASPQRPLNLEVQRGRDVLRIEVVPDAQPSDRPEEAGRTIGRIGAGVSSRVEMAEVRYGGFDAVGRSIVKTWDMSIFSLRMIGKMVLGELSWRNLSGPVTIADYAGQSARVGWYAYLSFLALISISLGVLNLLPIPVLDGGHLVYYGLEALRGRPLSERFVELTQKAGIAVIAAMMVVALFNDLTRLIGS